ncbi:MAG: hypothetical protein EXR82_11295, partial [Gammaproteobacteria bacterium]|nr:hypothetical protein [Gammaproteobacteria bacterium]
MTRGRRSFLLLAWLVVVAALGFYVQQRLVISGDLRLFMPAPSTRAERLLLDEVGQGPASRLLLVGLTGAPPEALAETSVALAERLRADSKFQLVTNGETRTDGLTDELLPYRYLLSRTLDTNRLDGPFLARELQRRVRDLASPAADLLEPWLRRDPTLEVLNLVQAWQQPTEPERLYDVWFDGGGTTALLLVQTRGEGFNSESQQAAINALRKNFADSRKAAGEQLIVTGPGAFSALMKERTQSEAQLIGAIDTITILALLFFAYRSPRSVVLAVLP